MKDISNKISAIKSQVFWIVLSLAVRDTRNGILSNTNETSAEVIRLEIVMVVNLLLVIISNCTGALSTRPHVTDAEVGTQSQKYSELRWNRVTNQ